MLAQLHGEHTYRHFFPSYCLGAGVGPQDRQQDQRRAAEHRRAATPALPPQSQYWSAQFRMDTTSWNQAGNYLFLFPTHSATSVRDNLQQTPSLHVKNSYCLCIVIYYKHLYGEMVWDLPFESTGSSSRALLLRNLE